MRSTNMDLSHAPVPANEWARRPPVWSTQYASSGLDTGVHSYPGFEVPVPSATAESTDGAKWYASQKLIAGAIGMGLVLGVTALMLVTGSIQRDDDDLEASTSVSAASTAGTPTQATPPTQAKQKHARVESRFRADWEFPVKDPAPEAETTTPPAAPRAATTRRPVVKHPIPRAPQTQTKVADADVAQARALLRVSNQETTLK